MRVNTEDHGGAAHMAAQLKEIYGAATLDEAVMRAVAIAKKLADCADSHGNVVIRDMSHETSRPTPLYVH